MSKIFICYRRQDSEYFAAQLYDTLVLHFGADHVVFDIDTIPPGTDYREYLAEAVGGCDVLLAVIGDRWLELLTSRRAWGVFEMIGDRLERRRSQPSARDFVRVEIEAALKRNIRVIPILIGNASMPNAAGLPDSLKPLAYKHSEEVRAGTHLKADLQRVSNKVRKILEEDAARAAERLQQAKVAAEEAIEEPIFKPQGPVHAADSAKGQITAPEVAESKTGRMPRLRKLQMAAAMHRERIFKVFVITLVGLFVAASTVVLYFYGHYSKDIDRRLSGEVFTTTQIYAAPVRVYPGQKLTVEAVVERLKRAGYASEDKSRSDNLDGVYDLTGTTLRVRPAVGEEIRFQFQKNVVSRILGPDGERSEVWLPPEQITNLFDEAREKQQIIEYRQLPKVLVDALIAAQDKHFFSHWGIDPIRTLGGIFQSIRGVTAVSTPGTITEQLARSFFPTPSRSITEGIREAFIAMMLEQRLTKQQILTLHVNQVYLGRPGLFSIRGFAEGATSFFGKDLSSLTLPEAAMLVAVSQDPDADLLREHIDEAKGRRNAVLASMHAHGAIGDEELETAERAELKIVPLALATNTAYLVDYLREDLKKDFTKDILANGNLRVYTSLDPALQRIADEAVTRGLKSIEEQIAIGNRRRDITDNLPGPQAALIVLDPHTGEIKAMVGGRDYAIDQNNRIVRSRQAGSIFKPFVYAAAFEAAAPTANTRKTSSTTGTKGETISDSVLTPLTTLTDERTAFGVYEPNNYNEPYRGLVTLRNALQSSLNVPAVKVAERIGYGKVIEFAKRLGLTGIPDGRKSIAVGQFDATALEMAGAYTAFANGGLRLQPHVLLRVTSPENSENKVYKYEAQKVMQPQLAYLMTYLLQGVIKSGVGSSVRIKFLLPAAGMTGTSRDGWFAGYTKDLLAIVWTGYDDYRELNLEGAKSALPIWTEFMVRAYELYPPRDQTDFPAPPGIETKN